MIELKGAGRYHPFPSFDDQQPSHPSETTRACVQKLIKVSAPSDVFLEMHKEDYKHMDLYGYLWSHRKNNYYLNNIYIV